MQSFSIHHSLVLTAMTVIGLMLAFGRYPAADRRSGRPHDWARLDPCLSGWRHSDGLARAAGAVERACVRHRSADDDEAAIAAAAPASSSSRSISMVNPPLPACSPTRSMTSPTSRSPPLRKPPRSACIGSPTSFAASANAMAASSSSPIWGVFSKLRVPERRLLQHQKKELHRETDNQDQTGGDVHRRETIGRLTADLEGDTLRPLVLMIKYWGVGSAAGLWSSERIGSVP